MAGDTWGFVWYVSPDVLAENLDAWTEAFMGRLEKVMEEAGVKIEGYAKSNHPWSNVTGAAEAALATKVFKEGNNFTLILWYDPSNGDGSIHGFWLEFAHNGRWGVIRVAMQANYNMVMESIRAILSG